MTKMVITTCKVGKWSLIDKQPCKKFSDKLEMCILITNVIQISGIREALQLLQETDDSAAGTLIVVSDGQENRSPYIRDVWDEV